MVPTVGNINAEAIAMRMKHGQGQANPVKTGAGGLSEKDAFNKELKQACNGFEELFVHKMIQVMRESNQTGHLLHGGRGEEIFQDMLDQQYSKEFTKSGGIGLGDMIYQNTKRD